MNHLHQAHGERNTQIATAARTSFAMQASFLSSSIEEEDFIDNIEPDLVESTSADSCSSHVGLGLATDNNVGLDVGFVRQLRPTVSQDWEGKYRPNAEAKPSTSSSSACNLNKSAEEYMSRPALPKAKLSLSMHDISAIPTYPLTPKSSHFSSSTIQSHSMTTDASLPKSKDSGFPRSSSCFSLNSSKSYVHVQSKVKEYIKQIKAENEAHRRSSSSKGCLNTTVRPSPSEQDLVHDDTISVKMLVPLIHKLKDELEDKDKMLSTLQENYDSLLLKYAKSKNHIDHLRFRPHTADIVSPTPFNFDKAEYKKPPASPSLLLLPKLHELQNEPCDLRLKQPHKSNHKGRASTLNPVTKAYSSSVRLDKLFEHPLISGESKEAVEYPSTSSTKYSPATLKVMDVNKYTASLSEQLECDGNINHKVLTNKELSPERLNSQFSENPFIKVKRWQESLPSFELIEPGNNYDSLNSQASRDNETSDSLYLNQVSSDSMSSKQDTTNITKDDASTNTNKSNLLLSRSTSEPNNCYSFQDLPANRLSASSCLSPSTPLFSKPCKFNFDRNWIPHSDTGAVGLLSNVTDVQNSNTSASSLNTTNSRSDLSQNPTACNHSPHAFRHKASGRTDSSSLNRKKQLGQKARLILFEYLKASHNHSKNPFCCVNKSANLQEKTRSECTGTREGLKVVKETESDRSYDDEDVTLSECLDAMNQSCSNLRGKSEAIIQVLAKQLKDNM